MSEKPAWQNPQAPLYVGMSLGALALIATFLLLFKAPESPVRNDRRESSIAVGLAKLDDKGRGSHLTAVQEEALLRDPNPLFLPTPRNSAQAVLPLRVLREPGDTFPGYAAKKTFGDSSVSLLLPPPVALPGRPADDLGRMPTDKPFLGLGTKDKPKVQFSGRKAFLEIYSADQGRLILGMDLTDVPLMESLDWQPCEFFLRVDAAGLVGQPLLVGSTRSEVTDRLLLDYLEKHWIVIGSKARVGAGSYRLVVGP